MSTSDNSVDQTAANTHPTETSPVEPEATDEDPEAAGNILRGNMMFVLVVGLAVLIDFWHCCSPPDATSSGARVFEDRAQIPAVDLCVGDRCRARGDGSGVATRVRNPQTLTSRDSFSGSTELHAPTRHRAP
jgi:hypothetical protein